MKIGVMVGPERGDTGRKVKRLLEEIAWAESAGIPTAWIPQVPSDMDALQMVALLGARTERIELGTAVVPLQAQHPVALARQALTAHAVAGGRLALGVGPSHHWVVADMLGLPYDKPAGYTPDYLQVLDAAWRACDEGGTRSIDVDNATFTVHNPFDVAPVAPLAVSLRRKVIPVGGGASLTGTHHRQRVPDPAAAAPPTGTGRVRATCVDDKVDG
jgi:alkanesulfonate monooxygenase SsuD/methylene tetrahydromethanopterin reductase-like flavin-dependent oxidoreductase (luciferase family)